MSHKIAALAKSMGFDLVSFTSAALEGDGFQHYCDWVTSGRMGSMAYMHRDVERRRDVRQLVPQARSVICLGVNHYRLRREKPTQTREGNRPVGQVARYAYGQDYHVVVQKMLKEFVQKLEKEYPTEIFRRTVDTGAILERAYAEQSGLGRIGKNATLITPQFGSWVFLCEVITTLDLSTPKNSGENSDGNVLADPCGHCRLCLDICPTGALVGPYELDARKCISYWTIEHRGSIPETMRPLIGDWLYGCDLCQEVCPQNVRAVAGSVEGISVTKIGGDHQLLEEILALKTEKEFRKRFKGSAMLRAKREGLVRNACVVAGNLKACELLPQLRDLAANDPSEVVREHAAWAVAQMDS